MIRLKISNNPFLKVGDSGDSTLKTGVSYEIYPAYTGSYEITPTTQTQTIPINGKRATQNIVVNPIPSNYGLVTWNGSVLTVE